MIKEIRIKNFYSFSEETIILQPDVNILIGINGSGKSNFFKAVRLLKEGVAGKGLRAYFLEDLGGFDNIFFKGKQENQENAIEIEYVLNWAVISNGDFKNHTNMNYFYYKIRIVKFSSFQNYYIEESISRNKKTTLFGTEGFEDQNLYFSNGTGWMSGDNHDWKDNTKYSNFNPQELALREVGDADDKYTLLATLKKAISNIVVYDYFDTTPRSAIRRAILATSDRRLNANGGNLTQILNTIKINYKEIYRKIIEMLGEVNANFSGFDYHIMGGSNIELMLDEKELNSSIHVSGISDGTLKYLCLLAVLYNPERGKFICIDEPETGLHPDMILNIANAIKEASEQTTLVIATHSVDLLNYFRVENLQVFEKDENNATKVVIYKKKQFEGWYDTFNVGQMWVAGDFGGVRYGG